MSTVVDDVLKHFGSKGMRWGVRKNHLKVGTSNDHLGVVNLRTLNITNAVKTIPLSVKAQKNPTGANATKTATSTHLVGLRLINGTTGPTAPGGSVHEFNKSWHASGKILAVGHLDEYDTQISKFLTQEASKYTKIGTNARVHIVRNKNHEADLILTMGSKTANNAYHRGLMKNPDHTAVHADSSDNLDVMIFTAVLDDSGLIIGLKPKEEAMNHNDSVDKVLEHFGTKGMRWGVRKLQSRGKTEGIDVTSERGQVIKVPYNPKKLDVTFTPGGGANIRGEKREVKRVGDAIRSAQAKNEHFDAHGPSTDHINTSRSRAKSPSQLSNAEMKALIDRMDLEKKYKDLITPKVVVAPVQIKALSRKRKAAKWVGALMLDIGKTELTKVAKSRASMGVEGALRGAGHHDLADRVTPKDVMKKRDAATRKAEEAAKAAASASEPKKKKKKDKGN